MMKLCLFIFLLGTSIIVFSQGAPNLTNSANLSSMSEKASKLSSVPVNIFTGVPQVGVPIYSYDNPNNGLSLTISLDYFAGGTQVAEAPTTTGLGWFLNAGGSITRIVRGSPDDIATTGYMYASSIPSDYRSNGDKYYYDSLDAQQDIFQFNFNGRSGKFFIGKNGQVVVVPTSKIKIIPITPTGSLITAFRIITEDGIKYDFNDAESTVITTDGVDSSLFRSAYSGVGYNTAWHLSRIISSFYTDTIKINYTSTSETAGFAYPQVTFVRNSDAVRTKTYSSTGTNSSTIFKISSITFPENTNVTFLYNTYGLVKIKIGDTAFKYGYLLDYYSHDAYGNYINYLLKSVTPYTSKEKKDGYQFYYNYPLFRRTGSGEDTLYDKVDYWGYYNGVYNGANLIPQVNGYTWGANRNPNITYAIANSLSSYYVPSGGFIFYEYELNTHYPYLKEPHRLIVNPTTYSTTSTTLSQVFNPKHRLVFSLDSSISRQGSSPSVVLEIGRLILKAVMEALRMQPQQLR